MPFQPRLQRMIDFWERQIPEYDSELSNQFSDIVASLKSEGACTSCLHSDWFINRMRVEEIVQNKDIVTYPFYFEMSLCPKWTTAVANSRPQENNKPGIPKFCSAHSSLEQSENAGGGSIEVIDPSQSQITIPDGKSFFEMRERVVGDKNQPLNAK